MLPVKYVPAWHSEPHWPELFAAAVLVVLPLGHATHDREPEDAWYWPFGHARHPRWPVDCW